MNRRSDRAGRAPRLGPRDRIAPHMTRDRRSGRFRSIDPTKPRPLPRLGRVVGVVAWALLVEESLRRAHRASRSSETAAT